MNFGLKDFFMSVVHLFVIFLPGSLLLLTLLMALPGNFKIDDSLLTRNISATGLTLVFIGASYLLGHLVSLIASKFEDVYSKRPWGKRRSKEVSESLRANAYEICVRELDDALVEYPGFRKWAQHLARHGDDAIRGEIDALDADRRFFRNTRFVLIAPLILSTIQFRGENGTWAIPAALAFITVLSWWRYYDQDGKFTKLVFESLILLYADADSYAKANDRVKKTRRNI